MSWLSDHNPVQFVLDDVSGTWQAITGQNGQTFHTITNEAAKGNLTKAVPQSAYANPPSAPGGSLGAFGKWLAGIGLLTVILLTMDSSGEYAGVGLALAWLIVGSFYFVHFKDVTMGFDHAFGTTFTPQS